MTPRVAVIMVVTCAITPRDRIRHHYGHIALDRRAATGNRRDSAIGCHLVATATAHDEPAPDAFVRAVDQLRAGLGESGFTIMQTAAPQGISPYSYAIEAEIDPPQGADTHGKLILLHDPSGHDSWNGTLRLVTYISADVDTAMAADPMLSPVAWSWLLDGLGSCDAAFTAAGGTVTCTTSTRFGDLRQPRDFGADSEAVLELRASWTPCGDDLAAHARAWQLLLGSASGVPPDGVT